MLDDPILVVTTLKYGLDLLPRARCILVFMREQKRVAVLPGRRGRCPVRTKLVFEQIQQRLLFGRAFKSTRQQIVGAGWVGYLETEATGSACA